MENQQEIWKDIKGYEGLYQVSNLGRVKSLERILHYCDGRHRPVKEKLLSCGVCKVGYRQVKLRLNKKTKTHYVHRLVANTFILNLESKPQVNHKDGNKINNNIDNLEWVTHSENLQHSYDKLGRKGYWTGKTQSKEHRLKNRLANLGEKNHFYGKKHTEETKRKISEANKKFKLK